MRALGPNVESRDVPGIQERDGNIPVSPYCVPNAFPDNMDGVASPQASFTERRIVARTQLGVMHQTFVCCRT